MFLKHCTCPSYSSFIVWISAFMATRVDTEEESPSFKLGGFPQSIRPSEDMPPLYDTQAANILSQLSGWSACRSHYLHCSMTGIFWQKVPVGCVGFAWCVSCGSATCLPLKHKKEKKKIIIIAQLLKWPKTFKYLPNESIIISSMWKTSVWQADNKAYFGALTCDNCGDCCWLCPCSPITVPCVSVTVQWWIAAQDHPSFKIAQIPFQYWHTFRTRGNAYLHAHFRTCT